MTIQIERDKYGMTPESNRYYSARLTWFNAWDLQMLNPTKCPPVPPEKNPAKGEFACNIMGLWNDLKLPELKSIQDMNFAEAWDTVMYDHIDFEAEYEKTKQRFESGKCTQEFYERNIASINRSRLKLLNEYDRRYFAAASLIWKDMPYQARLRFLADGRSKRERGVDPYSILMDIVDPYGHRNQHLDNSDGYCNPNETEWLM